MDTLHSIAEHVRHIDSEQTLMTEGLRSMVNSLAIQSEMLTKILRAVTEPAPDESPLTDLLARLVKATDANQALLHQIAEGVQRVEHRVHALRR